MKCQILLSGKSKENIANLSSELSQGVIKVNNIVCGPVIPVIALCICGKVQFSH